MAENKSVKSVLSVIATKKERLVNLPIKNGQMVFITDIGRVAFDYKDTRTFYNQITEVPTEEERKLLESPATGFYFVIDTAVLWSFNENGWQQLTGHPESIVFDEDVEVSGLGKANTLYVSKERKTISVYDEILDSFVVVANAEESGSIASEQIVSLFA